MSLLDTVVNKGSEEYFLPYINTGTLFDIATGRYRAGTKNNSVLDGGISNCMGITGRAQTYKSGLAGSLIARAMCIHPRAEALVWDTENTVVGAERYNDFVPANTPVSNRISFMNATNVNLSEFYEYIKKIANEKLEHKKDYLVDSPFLNPFTNKPFKTWVPTFVLIDSFSRARSTKGDTQFEDNNIDNSSMNTFYLNDGMAKTRLMNDLPTRASKAGIFVILTAHVGDTMDLDPYAPTPKQLQYMKRSDRVKNVGSGYEFLTTSMMQTLKAEVMQDSSKHCLYPDVYSTDNEVNLVTTMMVRSKSNASGAEVKYVLSQSQGILNSVTNFNFLRQYKNFGMTVKGNNQNFSSYLLPEVNLTRQNIRKTTAENYRAARALELTAQLCYIQNLWNKFRLPEYISTPVEKFAELLTHNEKMGVDRVLESTGSWSTSKQDREVLSILDVLTYLVKK